MTWIFYIEAYNRLIAAPVDGRTWKDAWRELNHSWFGGPFPIIVVTDDDGVISAVLPE